jgi:4,5-DOPA dioxygenase extradiol
MTSQPVLYLSHGAPPLADDRTWTRELASWSDGLQDAYAKPANILVVSAHWEEAPLALSSTTGAPLTYDFWGFPQRYYDVTYAAPSAPDLADDVAALVRTAGTPVHRAEARGLDHGAYVPLVEMFPDADVPVLQMSMPTLDPQALFRLGQRLAPLRDAGTLIVGSGFTTHNLREFDPSLPPDAPAPQWSREFDAWAQEAMAHDDVDALLDFLDKGPAAHTAHPRTEHFAPLFVSLGAAYGTDGAGRLDARSVIDGFWFGLSKRSWQLG